MNEFYEDGKPVPVKKDRGLPVEVVEPAFSYLGAATATLDGTARNLPAPPAGAIRAELQPQGADLRFRRSNSPDVTASSGTLVRDTVDVIEVDGAAAIAAFRYMAASGSGTLDVTWYGA